MINIAFHKTISYSTIKMITKKRGRHLMILPLLIGLSVTYLLLRAGLVAFSGASFVTLGNTGSVAFCGVTHAASFGRIHAAYSISSNTFSLSSTARISGRCVSVSLFTTTRDYRERKSCCESNQNHFCFHRYNLL